MWGWSRWISAVISLSLGYTTQSQAEVAEPFTSTIEHLAITDQLSRCSGYWLGLNALRRFMLVQPRHPELQSAMELIPDSESVALLTSSLLVKIRFPHGASDIKRDTVELDWRSSLLVERAVLMSQRYQATANLDSEQRPLGPTDDQRAYDIFIKDFEICALHTADAVDVFRDVNRKLLKLEEH